MEIKQPWSGDFAIENTRRVMVQNSFVASFLALLKIENFLDSELYFCLGLTNSTLQIRIISYFIM